MFYLEDYTTEELMLELKGQAAEEITKEILDGGRYVEFDGIKDYLIEGFMIVVEDKFANNPDPLNGITIFQYPDGIKREDIRYLIPEDASKEKAYEELEYVENRDRTNCMILKRDYSYHCYYKYY